MRNSPSVPRSAGYTYCNSLVPKELVGANGFEPSTSWSRISSRNTILLARLALFCVEQLIWTHKHEPTIHPGDCE
jgi:hypothetical protein